MQGMLAEVRLSEMTLAAMPLRRRGASRARILAATRELLRRRSYDALTMDAVAEAARLTRRTIYHQFLGRQSLYRASREALAKSVGTRLLNEISTTRSPREALLRFARQTLTALSGEEAGELLLSLVRDSEDHDWLAALWGRDCRQAVTGALTAWRPGSTAAADRLARLLEALALAPRLAAPGDALDMDAQLGPAVDAFLAA